MKKPFLYGSCALFAAALLTLMNSTAASASSCWKRWADAGVRAYYRANFEEAMTYLQRAVENLPGTDEEVPPQELDRVLQFLKDSTVREHQKAVRPATPSQPEFTRCPPEE